MPGLGAGRRLDQRRSGHLQRRRRPGAVWAGCSGSRTAALVPVKSNSCFAVHADGHHPAALEIVQFASVARPHGFHAAAWRDADRVAGAWETAGPTLPSSPVAFDAYASHLPSGDNAVPSAPSRPLVLTRNSGIEDGSATRRTISVAGLLLGELCRDQAAFRRPGVGDESDRSGKRAAVWLRHWPRPFRSDGASFRFVYPGSARPGSTPARTRRRRTSPSPAAVPEGRRSQISPDIDERHVLSVGRYARMPRRHHLGANRLRAPLRCG